ncbi:MAG TPA: DNA-3-methyladenine glycosylase [Nocardioidaceae bacterium]|nr:DNA-3-methyladenine glycosylase [Nocardioidaceae bacterium]
MPGCPDRSGADRSGADPSWAGLLAQPASEVAPRLLGAWFSHSTDEGTVTVELTEVEAYMGQADPASHAFRGPTPRNEVMFGEPGRLYVYRSYGMHWCCNVVTGHDGTASAVLLRAGRVVHGLDLARERRGERVKDRSLARGPGCLGQALGLSREQNGANLLADGPLCLRPGSLVPTDRIASGHRVGVTLAHDVPWRFWVLDEPTVSAYKRSPRAVVD